jgi:hypothetical protein
MNCICRTTLCFVLLLSSTVWGQWRRQMFSGKGGRTDVPTPHSLRYFTDDPFLRDDGGDFCLTCNPSDAVNVVATSELHPVGILHGFPVIEILYRFRDKQDPGPAPVKWKSILVKTGPDRYIEIWHLQAFFTNVPLKPSWIEHVGTEPVLATMDTDGGNGGGCWEEYWWFDASGPHELDFSAVASAIAKRIPAGAHFQTGCYALHLDQQMIQSWVQAKNAECHSCGGLGTVSAKFRLRRWRAEPLSVEYVAESQ